MSSANFYAFDHDTMSKDAADDLEDQSEVRAVDGLPDAGAGHQRRDGGSDAAGDGNFCRKRRCGSTRRGCRIIQTIQTEAPHHGLYEPQADRERSSTHWNWRSAIRS